jgi:hypothetical protein
LLRHYVPRNDGGVLLAFVRITLYPQIRLVLFYKTRMPKLSLIAAEAGRLLGHMHEARRLGLQQDLTGLCEAHWQALRGPEPTTPLAHALWSATPPLVDLFADLYTTGDAELDDVLQGHRPGWGLALLALAEIGRGDAEGAQVTHEPMMVFESEKAGAHLAARMAATLHGRMELPPLHKHAPRPPLWKALMVIAAHTGRSDLKAVAEVLRLLAAAPESSDAALEQLRKALDEVGIGFVAVEDDHVCYTQRGHEHKPASLKQLADSLFEIRQMQLG